MKTKEEIFIQLKDLLLELFELDEQLITLDAKLYEDLDLDSIDAVDMVVRLQDMTGKKILPEDFKNTRSVEDVIDLIYELIHATP